MSRFIPAPHSCVILLATVSTAALGITEKLTFNIPTNDVYERFTLRMTVNFKHGEKKPSLPKFGGIYNLARDGHVLINADEPNHKFTGLDLYTDTFSRSGRENNDLDYGDLPDSYTQNIEYCFSGSNTVLNGRVVPNALFGLDLRHTTAGNQTYNSVQMVINTGTIQDVFVDPGDTTIESITFEVYAEQIINTVESANAFSVNGPRYAETVCKRDSRKVVDISKTEEFTIEQIGEVTENVFLSDITIVQLDQNGQAVPFEDENAFVTIKVGEHDYCKSPIWRLREDQNKRRLQPVPPNMLHVPIVQAGGIFGGLGPAILNGNTAKICVQANEIDGQAGETQMLVLKTYSAKPK